MTRDELVKSLRAAIEALSAALPLVKARIIGLEMTSPASMTLHENEEVLDQIDAVLNPVQGAEPSNFLSEGLCVSAYERENIVAILNEYAKDNPRWKDSSGIMQDPLGVHKLIARLSKPSPVECTPSEGISGKTVHDLNVELTQANREIERLKSALSSVGHNRQFGLCWCETEAGIYCVDQPQCKAAREALQAKPTQQTNP